MADIILQKPQAGQATVVEPQSGDRINLQFAADSATITREGDSLTFTFDDGSSIELNNFYTAFSSENMPEFVIEGSIIPGESFFAALSEDLMPAAGNENTGPQNTGHGTDSVTGELLAGVGSRSSASVPGQEGSDGTEPVGLSGDGVNGNVFDLTNGTVVGEAVIANPTTSTAPTTPTAPSDPTTPTTPTTPSGPTFMAANDVLSADAGATINGNLLANDTLPAGTTISQIVLPDGWMATQTATGYSFSNGQGETLEVNADGTFSVSTDSAENFNFNYIATDLDGNTYTGTATVGNAANSSLVIDKLEGHSAIVTDENTGNSYELEFTDYTTTVSDNQHVKGMLLGDGDDTITINEANGTQGDVASADMGVDTFIYGDAINLNKTEEAGNDVINVEILNGTKIRADGNLFEGVHGGDDEVNVGTMEHGSILGDGWNLHNGSVGGDDTITVDTMHSGTIKGDGMSIASGHVGGDDEINIGTIDTTAAGRQTVTIGGDSGNDTISVDNIEMGSGDIVTIDGGLGDDIFNFNDDGDNTMAFRGDDLFISGNNASITNFEGVSTGGGDDLLKLYSGTDDIISVDTGDGMDVLLANASDLANVSKMLDNGDVDNTELLVFSDNLNDSSTTSTDDLFNKLEGVSQDETGQITVDSSWTAANDSSTPSGYSQFTSTDDSGNDMTILVAQTQLANTST